MVLRPQLRKNQVDSISEKKILEDTERRLVSIFRSWRNEVFRKTLLLPWMELAQFYQPGQVSLDARAIVVAGVRNGLIEEIHAAQPYNSAFIRTARISQDEMRLITGVSSRFFSSELVGAINDRYDAVADTDDVFLPLANAYPEAWRRLEALALLSGVDKIADIVTGHEQWHPENFDWHGDVNNERLEVQFESGVSPSISPRLGAVLSNFAATPKQMFFSNSFRGVSRDQGKLLRVLEHILACDGVIVTNNYVIQRDCVARRRPLVNGSSRNIKQSFIGVSAKHMAYLKTAYKKYL